MRRGPGGFDLLFFCNVVFQGVNVVFRKVFNLQPNSSFPGYVYNVKNDQHQIFFPTVYIILLVSRQKM